MRNRRPGPRRAPLHDSLPSLREKSSGDDSLRSTFSATKSSSRVSILSPAEQVKEWRDADLAEVSQTEQGDESTDAAIIALQNEALRSQLVRTKEELKRTKLQTEQMSRAQEERDAIINEKDKARDEVRYLKEQLASVVGENYRKDKLLKELTNANISRSAEMEKMREERTKKEDELADIAHNSESLRMDMIKMEEDNKLLEEQLHAMLSNRENGERTEQLQAAKFQSGDDGSETYSKREADQVQKETRIRLGKGEDDAATEFCLERIAQIQKYGAKSISRLYALVKHLRKEETREDHGNKRNKEDLSKILSLTEKSVLVQEELELSLQLIETRLTRRFEELRNGGRVQPINEETDRTMENTPMVRQMHAIEEEAMTALEREKSEIYKEIRVLKTRTRELKKEARNRHRTEGVREGAHIVFSDDDMIELKDNVCSVVSNSPDRDEAIVKISALFAACDKYRVPQKRDIGSTRSLLGSVVKYEDKKSEAALKGKSRQQIYKGKSTRQPSTKIFSQEPD